MMSFRFFVHFRTKQIDQIRISTLVDRTRRFDFEDEDEEGEASFHRIGRSVELTENRFERIDRGDAGGDGRSTVDG